MGINLGGGPRGQATGALSPDYSTFPGVVARVSTININSGAVQNLYTVPAGKTLHITEVVLRDPTANAALIEGSIGLIAACTNFAGFPPQSGLTGAGKHTSIYPSAIGESASIAAGATLGILLTTLAGVAGTMTVEVIGYLV